METLSSSASSLKLSTTAAAFGEWTLAPWRTVAKWLAGSLLAVAVLLLGTLVIAEVVPADRDISLTLPPVSQGDLGSLFTILSHNLLVLALHAMGCVAGFIAGSRIPRQIAEMDGWRRRVNRAGAAGALAFVVVATSFSMGRQIWLLGTAATSTAAELHTSPPLLLLAVLPHAGLELTGMFLPLAAWIIAARQRRWDQLLAAALATTLLALPLLFIAASWETFGAPHLIALVAGH